MIKMTLMDWLNSNIVPNQGEVCLAIDSLDIRFGDGENIWTALKGDYFGVKATSINDAGELIIIYNDGQEQNLGNVKGEKGETGSDGQDGTSITIASIVESAADGGENVVTFSDGQSITIKNGSKGTKGDTGGTGATGQKGADGKTPVKGTDYWTEADKVEIVNDVVSKTRIDVIPDYVITEADNVVDKILNAQGDRTFTFAAISDLHYGNGNYTDGVKHACQAIKYIDKQVKLDAVAVLGDYTDSWSQVHNTHGNYAEALKDFKDINNILDSLRVTTNLRIQGNHDYSYENFSKVARFINAYSDGVTWGSRAGGYFYKDFDEYKLRIICVNTDIILDQDMYRVQGSEGYLNCSNEQLEWFIDSLKLKADKGDDVENWSILVLSHQPLDWWSGASATGFGKILKDYKEGKTDSINALSKDNKNKITVTYDFSREENEKPVTIIGNIHGHLHNLKVNNLTSYGSNGNSIDYIRVATPEACIGRANNSYIGDTVWHEDYCYPKTTGSSDETSFIIYVIDLDKKIINAICYGAGYDRLIDYNNLTSINTFKVTNNLTDVTTDNMSDTVKSTDVAYYAKLTPKADYKLGSVKVTMGKTLDTETYQYLTNDITSACYNSLTGEISISSIESDIAITATAGLKTGYSVESDLYYVTTDNAATQVADGASYKASLTGDNGIGSVKVEMGGSDITSSCYSNGVIEIPEVTGDIKITNSSNIIDSVGYQDGYRMSTSQGSPAELAGYVASGFIYTGDFKQGDLLYIKGVDCNDKISGTSGYNCGICFYDEDKNYFGKDTGGSYTSEGAKLGGYTFTFTDDRNNGYLTIYRHGGVDTMPTYIRISGVGTGANFEVTKITAAKISVGLTATTAIIGSTLGDLRESLKVSINYSDGEVLDIDNYNLSIRNSDNSLSTDDEELIAEGTNTIVVGYAGNGTDITVQGVAGTGTPSYTNLIPQATDIDGSIYGTNGYKTDTRFSVTAQTNTGNGEEPMEGMCLTGYIACNEGDTVRLKNVTVKGSKDSYIVEYYQDKSYKQVIWVTSMLTDDGNGVYTGTAPLTGWIRITCGVIDDTSILTLNEEIV